MGFFINFIKQYYGLGIIIFGLFIIFYLSLPPQKEIDRYSFVVEEGQAIRTISDNLKNQNLIKSKTLFNILNRLTNDKIIAGDYLFEEKENVFTIVRRLSQGDYKYPVYTITFPEGMTVRDIAERISFYIPNFDAEQFIFLATPNEGFLFPDTYRIPESIKPEQLVVMMENNFYRQITKIDSLIKNSKYTLKQIIIMASIIEKEATADTRQEVGNILWKRFEEDFPLQVDAPFVYTVGRGSFDITRDDLASEDPYNTYRFVGLIPTPIANPGIESIKAAANPVPTENFYFLTGRDGEMYFAKDFEGHKLNRRNHLD
jgi:UPF0755 protein